MYDAIVVGGGIVGMATAYHLVVNGARTLLIDRHDRGRATDAGAGIISPSTNTRDSDEWYEFASQAGAHYPTLIADVEGPHPGSAGYARTGLLLVAASEDEMLPFEEARRRIFDRQRSHGHPAHDDIQEISPAEARRLFPPLTHVEWAIYSRAAARVDGRRLTEVMQRAAEARGLTIRLAGVDSLALGGEQVTGVVVGGETVAAPRVIIAGGAWSPAFEQQLGLRLPLEPQRGQIAHLRLRGVDTDGWPVVNAFRGHYLVAWPGGRIAAGATREFGTGYDSRVTTSGMHEVLREALRVAPGLADATFEECRVGLRPLAADGLPILGPVPGRDGVWLATGHGPTGLTAGPYSGKVVAEATLGLEPSSDLAPFSVARFSTADE